MMKMTSREDNIKFVVELTKKAFITKQYNRLINNKLFPEENFNVVFDTQMDYLIQNEEYEKCSNLLKLKKIKI